MGRKKNGTKRPAATQRPHIEEDVEDDPDDEEIDEDEAFNSDDERKYGSFFVNSTVDDEFDDEDDESDAEINEDDSNDDDDGDSSDESAEHDDDVSQDDEEGDGGQYMLDLLRNLDDDKTNKTDRMLDITTRSQTPHVKESQFASAVIPKAGLTLDTLMDGLKDTKGFGAVQKSMKTVAQGHAVTAPLAKVIADRTERTVHYEMQSKEVSQWSHAVHENRRAETLDFRPKQQLDVTVMTREQMLDQYEPTTEFEKQIHAALQEAGQLDEEAMIQAEEDALNDDLGANEITIEEYKRRRGQLAKMRALMFYHEQKRHHMNKIKSKKYRRIRKKQREKMKEAEIEAQVEDDPTMAQELQLKEEVDRIKERASLAHKNTSKWAKRILKRGKTVDVDTRRALSAQLKRGDDLRKRMNSTSNGSDSENDDNEEDLVASARKVLAETEDDNEAHLGPGKGLFQLSFMKKGIEKQRERAREEARQLLLELEANENLEDFDGNQKTDDDEKGPSTKKRPKVASKAEMNHILHDGDLVASSLKYGISTSVAVTGEIALDLGFSNNSHDVAKNPCGSEAVASETARAAEIGDLVSEHQATLAASAIQSENKQKSSLSRTRTSKSTVTSATEIHDESNPWLAIVDANGDSGRSTAKDNNPATQSRLAKRTTKAGFVDVDRAVNLLESVAVETSTIVAAAVENTSLHEKPITTLTQDELVQRAFATQSALEIEAEFAKEKAMVEADENPTRVLKKEKDLTTSQGWGSWAGEGAPPPSKQRRLPTKLQAPEKKIEKRKRVDTKKPHVIISEKRMKKTADKFMLSTIPYPYTSRAEYERAMTGGIGREWNVTHSFKAMTRPEVITRTGKMIQPISKRVKQKRAPAKF